MSQPTPVAAYPTLESGKIRFGWELNKSQKPARKAEIRKVLYEEDGPNCSLCGLSLNWQPGQLTNVPDIDHIDEDKTNWRRSNLRLAHHSDNAALYQQRRNAHAVAALSYPVERKEEGATGERLPNHNNPITYTLHQLYTPRYWRYVLDLILSVGRNPQTAQQVEYIYPENVEKAAAVFTGCDIQTSHRYLDRVTNPINGLFVIRAVDGAAGPPVLRFRNSDFYGKSTEEILELFPLDGLWTREPFGGGPR